MAKYDDLKAAIKQAIKQNGNQEITGNLLQSTLLSMVDSLGENKEFLGFASPSTNPGTPKGEVFYFASGANEYVNFPTSSENETVVTRDGLNIIYNNTSTGFWNWKSLVEITQELGGATDKVVSQYALPFRIEESPEWAYIIKDAEDHVLFGIQQDGSVEWQVGIPAPIRNMFEEIVSSASDDKSELTDVINALKDKLTASLQAYQQTTDAAISSLQDTKVDKEDGKGLIDDEVKQRFEVTENEEWLTLMTDDEDHILFGIKRDTGEPYFPLNEMYHVEQNPEFLAVETDAEGKIIEGVRKDGTKVISKLESESIPTEKDIISTVVESSELSDKIADLKGSDGDILSLYPIRSEKPILANFKYHTVESGTYIKPNFTLLYFADLHSVSRRLGRIMKYYNQYKEYLDDIVSAGDANHSFIKDFSFWKENGASCVLNALGNHEVFGGSIEYSISENDKAEGIIKKYTVAYNVPTYSSKECYDKFIKPYLSETKINSVENKCYFYKDYESAKIRIIALDVYHWKEVINCKKEYSDGQTESYTSETYPNGDAIDKGEQADWFKDVLEDSRQKGFNVICLIHSPRIDTFIDCTFTNLDKPISSYGGTNKDKEYSDLVDAFMANHDDEYGAGKFICWLCGHCHSDAIGLSSDYPKQLKIIIDTAGCLRQPNVPQFDFTGNFDRIEETHSDDLFDIFAVDTEHKYISLHRVGCHSDSHGRHIGNLVYDYNNMKLLYNN